MIWNPLVMGSWNRKWLFFSIQILEPWLRCHVPGRVSAPATVFHFTSKPPLQKYAGTVLSYSRSHGSRSHHTGNSPWHRLPWRSSWRLPQWTPCRVTGGRLHYASRWELERARRTWLGPRPRWCSKWPGHCGKSPCRHLAAGPSSNTGSEGDLPTPRKKTPWW